MSFCNIFIFLRHLVQEKNWAASGGQGGGGIKTALLRGGGVCFWDLGGGGGWYPKKSQYERPSMGDALSCTLMETG